MSVSEGQRSGSVASAEPGPTTINRLLPPVVLCLAAVAAYANSFAGVFLFDDRLQILGHRRVQTLWPLWNALSRQRPVVDYTLAVNYALGGQTTWGFHLVNLCIHVLAGLTLFGVVRRTLTLSTGLVSGLRTHGTPDSPGARVTSEPRTSVRAGTAARVGTAVHAGSRRRSEHAGAALGHATRTVGHATRRSEHASPLAKGGQRGVALAFAIALLWLVHPLQTQSVTYLVQRGESLMGLFYLLTLYCVIRSATSVTIMAPKIWYALAVIACAMGMGSKAVMVTAPLVVLIYDWLFLSRSLSELLRRRWALYAGLFGTWIVLWICGVAPSVLDPSRQRAHVGFGYKGITPFDYLLTQMGVVLHYLRLSIWPSPLCLDYDWPTPGSAARILTGGVVLIVLLAATVWALRQRGYRHLAFCSLWFFIVLAPTSTIVPIKDVIFEHRMYLPLAAVLAVLVIGGYTILSRAAEALNVRGVGRTTLMAVPLILVSTSLAYTTVRRNAVYHSESEMWRDVLRTQPNSARAAENYGTGLMAEGKLAAALQALQEALRVAPESPAVHNGIGFCLVANGRTEKAIAAFQEAVRLKPAFARAHVNLGHALDELGKGPEAFEHFREAVRLQPGYVQARLSLGNALMVQGRVEDALAEYQTILQNDSKNVSAWVNLGTARFNLAQRRAAENRLSIDPDEVDKAIDAFRQALAIDSGTINAHNGLALALIALHRLEEAVDVFRQALILQPDSAGVHANMGRCMIQMDDIKGAIAHFRVACGFDRTNPTLFFQLGVLLRADGNLDGAVKALERVLELRPDHAGAGRALEELRRRDVGPNP